jgi:hypothetical protein
MKRPSFQFYPGDWLRDTALRSCSVGARGLWMDMISLMHEGTPYGFLKVNHKVILTPNLSRMVGATLPETEGWLAELESSGVFSRDEDGSIFSRRMIRDESVRLARASGGKLGGNPNLKVNPKVESKVNLHANLPPTPSSSSSSSYSYNDPLEAAAQSETPGGKDRAEKSAPASKRKQKPNPETDDEWMASLGKDAAYQGIDVNREHAKMARWCATNRQQPTRRRFINWLNRIEKPLNGPHSGTDPEIARKLGYHELL